MRRLARCGVIFLTENAAMNIVTVMLNAAKEIMKAAEKQALLNISIMAQVNAVRKKGVPDAVKSIPRLLPDL